MPKHESIRPRSEVRETPHYSEEEILGLDAPRYELVGHGQSMLVPRLLHDIYLPKNNTNQGIERFLGLYGLNSEKYDADENPRGILHQDLKVKGGLRINSHLVGGRAALLVLLNAPSEAISQFFSSYRHSHKEEGKYFSSAFSATLMRVRERQDQYPLHYRHLYPEEDALFQEIEKITGLSPYALFNPGHVPSLRGNGRTRPLKETLQIYKTAVSEECTTINQVARRMGKSKRTIQSIFSSVSKTKMFTDEASRIVREKYAL